MSVQTKQRTLAMMTGFEPIARFFATRSSFPCKVCQLRVSQLKGSVQKFLSAKRMLLSLFYLPQTIRIRLVGERGFEPPTPWSRTRCSTRLSHSPTLQALRVGNLGSLHAQIHCRTQNERATPRL